MRNSICGEVIGEPVITDVSQITIEWLQTVLERTQALRSGGLNRFEIQEQPSAWSRSVRLRLHYSQDSSGERPRSLFLKLCAGNEFGSSEIEYYCRDYVGSSDVPLVRCYDARYRDDPPAYHLLLDDMSATHVSGRNVVVTTELVRALGDATAALHAQRWTPQQLRQVSGARPSAVEIERYVAHSRGGLEPLLAMTSDDINAEWKPLLREIFASHPALMVARSCKDNGMCLVHGDINPSNVLAPIAWPGKVYLIDRQPFDWSLRVWLGVSDLAYLVCSYWPESVRRQYELLLLRHYHQALKSRGVMDYSWDQLWADYRLSVVQGAYVAVQWCALEQGRERMRWLWAAELRRAMRAFEDLNCRNLWMT